MYRPKESILFYNIRSYENQLRYSKLRELRRTKRDRKRQVVRSGFRQLQITTSTIISFQKSSKNNYIIFSLPINLSRRLQISRLIKLAYPQSVIVLLPVYTIIIAVILAKRLTWRRQIRFFNAYLFNIKIIGSPKNSFNKRFSRSRQSQI